MGNNEIRRERLRELMSQHGATQLANLLGYTQASFLSQMAGPNPTRDVTEKTARRYAEKLGLPPQYFERPFFDEVTSRAETKAEADDAAASNVALVADVIRLVGAICSTEKVELPAVKFADVVALAYVDTMEHQRTPRPEHIKQIVKLFK